MGGGWNGSNSGCIDAADRTSARFSARAMGASNRWASKAVPRSAAMTSSPLAAAARHETAGRRSTLHARRRRPASARPTRVRWRPVPTDIRSHPGVRDAAQRRQRSPRRQRREDVRDRCAAFAACLDDLARELRRARDQQEVADATDGTAPDAAAPRRVHGQPPAIMPIDQTRASLACLIVAAEARRHSGRVARAASILEPGGLVGRLETRPNEPERRAAPHRDERGPQRVTGTLPLGQIEHAGQRRQDFGEADGCAHVRRGRARRQSRGRERAGHARWAEESAVAAPPWRSAEMTGAPSRFTASRVPAAGAVVDRGSRDHARARW